MKDIKYALCQLKSIDEDFSPEDINHVLFRCEKEELDITNKKRGNYEIQGFGKFVYSGISHIQHEINKLKLKPTLDHKMFDNIRSGDWLIDYILNRTKEAHTFQLSCAYLESAINNYKNLPSYLKPSMFCSIIDTFYQLIKASILRKLNKSLVRIKINY